MIICRERQQACQRKIQQVSKTSACDTKKIGVKAIDDACHLSLRSGPPSTASLIEMIKSQKIIIETSTGQ